MQSTLTKKLVNDIIISLFSANDFDNSEEVNNIDA